ncbi:hypothetical protein K450DRAFT_221506 [Umbelopsis ramanniana AG]|uniref:Uncharacterized protein n=1 Tax=Umbelopsis ramanniana AG TaxID=1314678 RepID=A0AAD5HIB7_UMBRA|nr:uncharacterized protein K450DRAFT_221506 [Umbelopsis ramanniana AG]KAI8583501.1 hypothetical protein K450DRAFT_221506 [Umbelopsis ramanniana AG]
MLISIVIAKKSKPMRKCNEMSEKKKRKKSRVPLVLCLFISFISTLKNGWGRCI